MPALRPSSSLKNKTNAQPVGNRNTEATAEDFQEIGSILQDHADRIDGFEGANNANTNYGSFSSLPLLVATHHVGVPNSYAVIDPGNGTTPQIALWNDADQEWEVKTTQLTSKGSTISIGDNVSNIRVTDKQGTLYMMVSGTFLGPNATKLESYSPNSIYRAL